MSEVKFGALTGAERLKNQQSHEVQKNRLQTNPIAQNLSDMISGYNSERMIYQTELIDEVMQSSIPEEKDYSSIASDYAEEIDSTTNVKTDIKENLSLYKMDGVEVTTASTVDVSSNESMPKKEANNILNKTGKNGKTSITSNINNSIDSVSIENKHAEMVKNSGDEIPNRSYDNNLDGKNLKELTSLQNQAINNKNQDKRNEEVNNNSQVQEAEQNERTSEARMTNAQNASETAEKNLQNAQNVKQDAENEANVKAKEKDIANKEVVEVEDQIKETQDALVDDNKELKGLTEGKVNLEKEKTALKLETTELEKTKTDLKSREHSANTKIYTGKSKIESGEAHISSGEAKITSGESLLAEGESLIEEGESLDPIDNDKIARGQALKTQGEKEKAEGEAEKNEGKKEKAEGEAMLDAGQKELDAVQKEQKEVEQKLTEKNKKIKENDSRINEEKAQITAKETQINGKEAGINQLNQQKQLFETAAKLEDDDLKGALETLRQAGFYEQIAEKDAAEKMKNINNSIKSADAAKEFTKDIKSGVNKLFGQLLQSDTEYLKNIENTLEGKKANLDILSREGNISNQKNIQDNKKHFNYNNSNANNPIAEKNNERSSMSEQITQEKYQSKQNDELKRMVFQINNRENNQII